MESKEVTCPYCGSNHVLFIYKTVKDSIEIDRYFCDDCNKEFEFFKEIEKIDSRLQSLCNRCGTGMSSAWMACEHRQKGKYCYEVNTIEDDLEHRFNLFSDKEIYMLYRALSEAGFEIMLSDKYTKEEKTIFNDLLNELLEVSKRLNK